MVKDEWGLICLKEKVEEIGYTMDDSLGYFIGTEVGLQELVKDFDFWNLVNQSYNPKVIEIWVVKKGNGDDADACTGSGDEDEEESDDVNDDEEFVKNVDMNAEYGGLGSLMGSDGEATWLKWPKFLEDLEGSCPKFALGLTFKDKGEFREAITTYAIKEGKEMKYEKNDKVTIEPNVITQPEVSDNQWEIPDDILDAQWDQILLQTQDEIPVIKVPYKF
nr:uncharacterized protein LOC109190938 [Ipomoea batatas]